MDYIGMGNEIRKRRKVLCLSQATLAERAGVTLSFIGHIERGTRKASIETLVSISNALHISPDALLCHSLTISEGFPEAVNARGLCRIIRAAAAQLDAQMVKTELQARWRDTP